MKIESLLKNFGLPTKTWALMLTLVASYTYFIQGGGFNQNAIIGEIRQFVEKGTCDLGSWVEVTGDVSRYNGHVFSNKGPTVFFVAAPIYALLFYPVKWLGFDTTSITWQFIANHFITWIGSGLLSVLACLVLMRLASRVFKLSETKSLILGFTAGLGSLIFVYSTVAFAHSLEALTTVLFLDRLDLWKEEPTNRAKVKTLGLSIGAFILASQLNAPIVLGFGFYFLFFRKSISETLLLIAFSIIPLLPLFVYNQANFGFFLSSNRLYMAPEFVNQSLFLGVFDRPHFGRLWDIFGFGFRSLLLNHYYLLLLPFGAAALRNAFPKNRALFGVTLSIILLYTVILLTYNGWHGGSAFGPRYFMPGVICLLFLSASVVDRHLRIFSVFALASIAMTFVVVSTDIFHGETNLRPLMDTTFPRFRSRLFVELGYPSFPGFSTPLEHRFNLGHRLGLSGYQSLFPLLLVWAFGLTSAFRNRPKSSTNP